MSAQSRSALAETSVALSAGDGPLGVAGRLQVVNTQSPTLVLPQVLPWLGILALLATLFAASNIVLSLILGPRHPNPEKLSPYECGIVPIGSARQRFSVKFYMVAMLFIVFDIETVFMIPWAAYYRQLSCAVPLVNGACPAGQISFFGLGEMLVFMAILLAGFAYVWKKGAPHWD